MNLMDNDNHDLLVEKLNLSRLDTLVLNVILLPWSIWVLGLIVSGTPNRISVGSASNLQSGLIVLMMVLFFAFCMPLVVYAHGYIADNIRKRILAIKIFLFYGTLELLCAALIGVVHLYQFVEHQLPMSAFIFEVLSALAILTFGLFLPWLLLFTFSSRVLVRLGRWLSSQIPRRLAREGINPRELTGHMGIMLLVRSRCFFWLGFVFSVIELAIIEVLWIFSLVSSHIESTWRVALIFGWWISAYVVLGFLGSCWSAYKDFRSQQTR